MLKTFHCNMLDENCYVLSDDTTKECVIIDCGALYEEETSAIVSYIKDNGLTPVHLLCTHGHLDHNFGNAAMQKAFGLKPEIHFADEPLLLAIREQSSKFFGTSIDCDETTVGKLLNSTETITYGTQTLTLIPTPGHTEGGLVFYNKEEGIAFTGDTLFQMSIGRTDLEGGDYEKMLHSLHTLATTLPPATKIYPGHGPSTTMELELKYNPYLR